MRRERIIGCVREFGHDGGWILQSKSVRVMTAFHFGNRQRRLFGYCTMRQLAARLVRAGFHVLRFDYFGTGDSFGDTGEGDLASWCGDIETAIEELKEMTGAAKVDLAGLRLGANLSARVAVHRPKEIGKLILWEPLVADELAVAGFGCSTPGADRNPRSIKSGIAEGFARSAIL